MKRTWIVGLWMAVLSAATLAVANEPPVAVDDAYETSGGVSISVDSPGVLGNDSDPDGDQLTAVLVMGPETGAEFQLFTDGAFEYKPPDGFIGNDSFTYRADDGADQSLVATVRIRVLPGSGRQVFTDEAAFLLTVQSLGLEVVQEGFEDDLVWGGVRSDIVGGNHTAPSITNLGVTWTSNNDTSEVTTSEGAARTGQWGFYSLPHGDFATGIDCHLPGNCSDGWIASTDAPMQAAGGWVDTNTPFARLELILDGDAANPVDFGGVVVGTQKLFFGVIDPAGFLSVEFHETEGKDEDQKFVFGDDFSFGFAPSGGPTLAITGICPGEVTLSLSGATPLAAVGLLASRNPGTFVVPGGPCPGVTVDLDQPRLLVRLQVDASGAATIVRNTAAGHCGTLLQAVDTASCQTSEVASIP